MHGRNVCTDQSTSRIETFAKCGEYLSLSFSGVCLVM